MSTSPVPGSDAVVRPQILSRVRRQTESFRDVSRVLQELTEREPFLAQAIQFDVKEAIERYVGNTGPVMPIELIGLKHEFSRLTARMYEWMRLAYAELLNGGSSESAASGS